MIPSRKIKYLTFYKQHVRNMNHYLNKAHINQSDYKNIRN